MRWAAWAILLAACGPSERPIVKNCLDAPPGSTDGAGIFGQWSGAEYRYTLDQISDARAEWTTTEDRPRRDHWHLVGNLGLDAVVGNDGQVQAFAQAHGLEGLTRVDASTRNFGGGYSIIAIDGQSPWSSAYAWRPPDAQAERRFGMGYAKLDTCREELVVRRTLSAPAGDQPFVIDTVVLENRTDRDLSLVHYEVWDVNRHYYAEQLLRSGKLNPSLPENLDRERDALNARFTQRGEHAAGYAVITHQAVDPSLVAPYDSDAADDWHPPDIYLHDLDGVGSRFITDGARFWGAGDPSAPGDLNAGLLAPVSASGQPAALIAARELTVPAAGSVTLRYAFGTAATPPALGAAPERTVSFDAGREDWKREMAWHAYYLRALGGKQDYFEHATVNQGSAYYFLHGLDGAVRDFVFSAVALAYIDPELARETLLYAARMRFEGSRALAYSVSGVGKLSVAGIHARPSDLELFLWWGLAEYVFATGDRSLLDQAEPFWPRATSTARPIREHIRVGARYLLDEIGTGTHGLIKLGDGDWDDSITFYADSRDQAITVGESVANTAMATLIMPWAAELLEPDPTAAELRAAAQTQRARLAEQFTGEWYRRAWFGDGKPFGDQQLFLLPNAFALAGDNPTPSQAQALVQAMKAHLEDPSTTAMVQSWFRVEPTTSVPGVTDTGGSNPAITALGIWGYAHAGPDRAWDAFGKSTMAHKADAYPNIWYGIWSGPDSQYTSVSPLAGQTWASPATPMTDYPIMNSNQHAGVLLGMLRAAGIEPAVRDVGGVATGCLRIAPARPYTLDLPLLRIAAGGKSVRIEYRPIATGVVHLLLVAPTRFASITVGGAAQSIDPMATEAVVRVPITRGVPVAVEASFL